MAIRSTSFWLDSPLPTSATPEVDAPSRLSEAVGVAGLLGIELMGWQRLVLGRALQVDGGRPVFREVDLSTPRQVGKSTLTLIAALRKMLYEEGSWVTYTTASRLAGRRKLLQLWWPLILRSPLASMFSVSRGTGSEALECSNGSVFLLLSGDEASGHGDSIDLAFLDEAWSLSESSEQAVRPAMASRSAAQLWVYSTAGTSRSVFWRSKVEAGREAAKAGLVSSTMFVEWSAADVQNPTSDELVWPTFHPGLGRTIDVGTMRADLEADVTPSKSEWLRAYGNLWPDETAAGWGVISLDEWRRATGGG